MRHGGLTFRTGPDTEGCLPLGLGRAQQPASAATWALALRASSLIMDSNPPSSRQHIQDLLLCGVPSAHCPHGVCQSVLGLLNGLRAAATTLRLRPGGPYQQTEHGGGPSPSPPSQRATAST